ncbi:MAG: chemotaxis protein CheA [Pseudomonadota bacterium]
MSGSAAESFVQEARELLEELETSLLELENGSDPETIDTAFRALHTVKGSGSMFGFDRLAAFTHHFETAFDALRDGRLSVDSALIDLSLKARDQMSSMLEAGADAPGASDAPPSPEAQALIEALQQVTAGAAGGGGAGSSGSGSGSAGGGAGGGGNGPSGPTSGGQRPERCYRIHFRPATDVLRGGMRPDLLIAELAELGRVEVSLDTEMLPSLVDLDPALCHLAWNVKLWTTESRSTIEAVFIFADDAELVIEEQADQDPAEPEEATAGPQTDVETEAAPSAPSEPSPPAAAAQQAAPAASNGARDADRRSQGTDAPSREPKRSAEGAESVRVAAVRLDAMMDQLGELVIAQSRLRQVADRLADQGLSSVVEEVERFVTALRDMTLSLRMLPIEVVFGKFRRVVRDLSSTLNKDVRLVTRGGETEIDKNVIDRLSEPLVHMIRNSVDHGVEDAEARQAAGKPLAATVTLSAWQQGGEVLISVADDGRGLDTEAIRRKAIDRGLIAADADIDDAAIRQLIFAPGFSTAATLTNVSGRGVGMDAVKSAVEALRGKITVDSEPGQGTAITLHMPVTLAIIDGFLVRVGQQVFVIPLAVVEECVEFAVATANHDSGRRVIELRNELVAYIDLAELFGMQEAHEKGRRVVVVAAGGRRIGLVVDDVLGQNQTVIKTLSAYHKDIPGLSGATILGDGAVALILDVGALAELAVTADAARRAGHLGSVSERVRAALAAEPVS